MVCTMKKTSNIFVVFTAYHYECVKILIDSYNMENNILISTINIKDFKGESHVFNKIYSLPSFINEIFSRKRKKIFLKLFIQNKNVENIEIFIPHYFNLNSNYLANFLFPNAKINIIPDGILSFYPYKLTFKDNLKQIINIFSAMLFGLKYKLLFSNIINPFNKINKIYSYEPSITFSYGGIKIEKIPYIQNLKKINMYNNLLILGTSTKLQSDDFISLILNLIKEKNIKKIYYKKHPSITFDIFYEQIKIKIPNIYLFDNNKSSEYLIKNHQILNIISIKFSTTLIEVQRYYKNQLNCYISISTINHHQKYFNILLKKYNIKDLK